MTTGDSARTPKSTERRPALAPPLLGGELKLSRIGFGAMHLTGEGVWGQPEDPARARSVARKAVELGVNFIDTADIYGPGVSERLLAGALHPYPASLVIATKAGFHKSGRGRVHPDGRPSHLVMACDESLRRLRLEQLHLYQLHTVDPHVPIEDSVGALASLQVEGKVRHIGLSNVTVAQYERASAVAPIAAIQNRFSLGYRGGEDVLELCEKEGILFIAYQPLQLSLLSPKRMRSLDSIATNHRATRAQVAIAWLLRRSPVIVPIPGTSSPEHLQENLGAEGVELTDSDFSSLTDPS